MLLNEFNQKTDSLTVQKTVLCIQTQEQTHCKENSKPIHVEKKFLEYNEYI